MRISSVTYTVVGRMLSADDAHATLRGEVLVPNKAILTRLPRQ